MRRTILRRILLVGAAVVMMSVGLAPPAHAYESGTVCRSHDHPNSQVRPNDWFTICVMVNSHDFLWKKEALARTTGHGFNPDVYIDYLRLYRGTKIVVRTNPDTWGYRVPFEHSTDWYTGCFPWLVQWRAEIRYRYRTSTDVPGGGTYTSPFFTMSSDIVSEWSDCG